MQSISDHIFLSFDLTNFFFNISRALSFPINITRTYYIAFYSARAFSILYG